MVSRILKCLIMTQTDYKWLNSQSNSEPRALTSTSFTPQPFSEEVVVPCTILLAWNTPTHIHNHKYIFCFYRFPWSGLSYLRNHIMCGVLWLTYFTSVQETCLSRSRLGTDLLSILPTSHWPKRVTGPNPTQWHRKYTLPIKDSGKGQKNCLYTEC